MLQRYVKVVLDSRGQPLAGVEISVLFAGTASPVPIYTDPFGVTPKANPFFNEANGVVKFYHRSARISVVAAREGGSFVDDDQDTLTLTDPITLDAFLASWGSDFTSVFASSTSRLCDGGVHLIAAGTVQTKTPTTTYANGWLDILGTGSVAPKVMQANGAGAFVAPWVITAAPFIFEVRAEKVTATATTLRVGLGSADLSAGDPAHGFYIRQVDSANAFLVVRSGSADSGTVDLGVALGSVRKITILARNAGIRVFVDNVPKTEVFASIPGAQMLGFSAASSATGSGVGLSLDYARVWSPR